MAKKKTMWFGIIGVKKLDKKGYMDLIKKIGMFAVASFVVSVVVFMAIALFGNFSKVMEVASTANLWVYSLAFVAVFVGFLLKYCKWSYYMKKLGLKVPARKNFAVYMSVYSMDITPARIGRVVAAYTLNRITKIKFAQIVPIVTMDIFTDFLGTAILALIVSLYLNRYVVYVAVVDFLLLIPFVFIIDDWLYNLIKKHLKSGRFLRLFSIYGDQYYASQSVLNNPRIYLTSLIFTLPAELLNSMALYFTLRSIGVIPSVSESVFAYSTTLIFGMVSSLPGGIGVTDGTMVALLNTVYGLSTAVSSAATIMSRMATLWFGVILGAIFLAYTVRYWNTKGKKRKD
jgi:glycosyltransferase 2 family protein